MRTSRLLKKIKTTQAKAEHQNVNIHDLSDYLGISVELVQQQLVD